MCVCVCVEGWEEGRNEIRLNKILNLLKLSDEYRGVL